MVLHIPSITNDEEIDQKRKRINYGNKKHGILYLKSFPKVSVYFLNHW